MKKIITGFFLLLISCGGGSKDSDNPKSVPEAPSTPVLVAADKQITASWNAVSSAVVYEVWYGSTNSSVSSVKFAEPNDSDTTCVLTGLTNGIEYYIWIKAKNSAGTSSFSSSSSATPSAPIVKPSAPETPVLTKGDCQITVNWTAITDATSYETWYGPTNDSLSAVKFSDPDDTDTACVITGLSNGTIYYVWVKAKNSAGTSNFSSSANATPETPIVKPSAPTAPLLTIRSCQITASWTAVTGASSYETWYGTTNNIANAVKFADPVDTDTTCAITSLSNGVTYYVWIKAKNSAGTSDFGPYSSAIPSYYDPTFGTNGKSVISPNSTAGIINNCSSGIVAPDGKIIIVGTSNSDFSVIRLNTDGSPDSGFGSGGIITTDINSGSTDSVYACAVQQDSKILVLGTSGSSVALVRYNNDGSLDTGFGSSGKVLNSSLIDVKGIAIRKDDKIVLTGAKYYTTYTDISVLCLNNDGSIDTSFGTSGLVSYHCQTTSTGAAVAIQNDGKIIVTGTYDDYGPLAGSTATLHFYGFITMRLNLDGSFDTLFGTNGVKTLSFSGEKKAVAVDIQQDGKIVVAGQAISEYHSSGGYNDDIIVTRMNSNGSLDTTFNTTGYLIFNNSSSTYVYDFVHSVKVTADGKILLSGVFIYKMNSSNWYFHAGIISIKSDGILDSTFLGGYSGYNEININNTNCSQAFYTGVQSDGKIIIIGSVGLGYGSTPADFFVLRFLP
jgi:uncharacterized delta-60 repeat protein